MDTSTLAILRAALKTFVNACPGPMPNDYYAAQHWMMAGAHAFITNGLISIYEQASSIPESKYVDFVGYALQWTAATHHHHHVEETTYFPLLSPKFDTSFAGAEHGTFRPGLQALENYLVSCLPSGTKYGHGSVAGPHERQAFDGAHVCALVDAFADDLCKHLVQEVTYMEPEKLIASGLTEEDMKVVADTSLEFSKTLPLTTLVTYAVLLTPKELDYPPFPALLRKYLVPHVLSIPNRKYWQFAPK